MVGFLGLVLFATASAEEADVDERLLQAGECREISARAARLACFDKLFNTPDAETEAVVEMPLEAPPEYWERLMRQERSRDGDSPAFLMDKRLDANGEPEQVLLTRPVRGSRGSVLAISCQDRITRLEVAMSQPLEQGPIGLTLVNGGDRRAERWRVRNEGWLVQAGRGLPAIRTLREWFGSDQVRLVSQERVLDGLVFELDELEQAMVPLRQACSW